MIAPNAYPTGGAAMLWRRACLAILLVGLLTPNVSAQGVDLTALIDVPPLSSADALSAARYIAALIDQDEHANNLLPEALRAETQPRVVFVSVSEGVQTARIVTGSGSGIARAAQDAAKQVRAIGGPDTRRWLKIDIVLTAAPLGTWRPHQALSPHPSLAGLALGDSSAVWLAEQLTSKGLVNQEGRLRQRRVTDWLLRHTGREVAALDQVLDGAIRFRTASFYRIGQNLISLYRGHRLYHRDELTAAQLLAAARMAGDYLIRSVDQHGRFAYLYVADEDRLADDYNILRHAGTIYAMLELYAVTKDDRLLAAVHRAMAFLISTVKTVKLNGRTVRCVVEGDKIKLGGNALAIVALAEYTHITGDRRHLKLMQDLAGWIAGAQRADGAFGMHQQEYSTGRPLAFRSQYYPGEAILALVRLHALDGDQRWLDAADRAANYIVRVRDAGLLAEQLPSDHWMLYALNELHRQRPAADYLHHTRRLIGNIVQSQNLTPTYADWLGSWHDPPRSTRAATRTEGLLAAWDLLRDFGRPDELEPLERTIRHGVAFQLQMQVDSAAAMYLPDPPRALGGFRGSLTDYRIRIDFVQHNLSSLIGLLLLNQAGPEQSRRNRDDPGSGDP